MIVFLQLFYEFFKAGLFSIGGGLATLPFLKAMTEKYNWFSPQDLTDMIAVSESTPGPIGINMSTYAGFNAGMSAGGFASGVLGAFMSTASLVLPSVIVIIIISKALERFRKSKLVDDAFYGLRPASAGLVLGAMFEVFVGTLFAFDNLNGFNSVFSVFKLKEIILFIACFILITKLKKLHPIVFIIGGCIIGIVFKF